MAVGGLGAYLIFTKRQRLLNIIYHPIVEKLVLFYMIGNFIWYSANDVPMKNLAISFLYILFILNVSTNPRSTVKLENRVFNYLGRISYGLYMYHNFVIYLVLLALSYTGFNQVNTLFYNVTLYTIVIGLTIGVSALSYNTFERFFLGFKDRFTIVASTPQPVEDPAVPPVAQPNLRSIGD
jgi:peptidoglycan/LPS O-acetylase OafA/YrhL